MEHSKKVRRRLRELAELAYERELGTELDALLKHFEEWKRKEINAFELSDLIHKFHQEPSRRLYGWYVTGLKESSVARAIAEGILSEDEVSDEILVLLEKITSMYRRDLDDDDS